MGKPVKGATVTAKAAATTESNAPDWWPYIQKLMDIEGIPSFNALAGRLGVASTTPVSWKDEGKQPRMPIVRKVAETFRRPISEVIVRAGYVTKEELGITADPLPTTDVEILAGVLTNDQVVELVRRRLGPGPGPALQRIEAGEDSRSALRRVEEDVKPARRTARSKG
jgi:DNA-binding XRE family transcriptional regulator